MKLKEWIKAQNKTQRDFAGMVGCSHEYLSRVLNGKEIPGKIFTAAVFYATGGDVDGEADIRTEGKSHEPL